MQVLEKKARVCLYIAPARPIQRNRVDDRLLIWVRGFHSGNDGIHLLRPAGYFDF